MITETVHTVTPGSVPIRMMTRRSLLAVCLLVLTTGPAGSQTPDQSLTLISADGRRALPTVTFDGRRMVALDELVDAFGLTVRDERRPGSLTVLRGDQVLVLTANQGLVSVDGRLVSLPSAPVQQDGDWYVPIDFIGRALSPILDTPVELRRRSGLVVAGDVSVPQIVARYRRTGAQARMTLIITPATEHRVERQDRRLLITFRANALDLAPTDLTPDPLVQGIGADQQRPAVVVDLGEQFGAYAAATEPSLGDAVELVIDFESVPPPTTSTQAAPQPAPPAVTPARPGLPPATAGWRLRWRNGSGRTTPHCGRSRSPRDPSPNRLVPVKPPRCSNSMAVRAPVAASPTSYAKAATPNRPYGVIRAWPRPFASLFGISAARPSSVVRPGTRTLSRWEPG